MNEQNPSTTPAPTGPARTERASKAEEPERFSAYDKTFLKFVGGVHDSKSKATKAAKDAGVDDFEIRTV